jgi:hypothetical protein
LNVSGCSSESRKPFEGLGLAHLREAFARREVFQEAFRDAVQRHAATIAQVSHRT